MDLQVLQMKEERYQLCQDRNGCMVWSEIDVALSRKKNHCAANRKAWKQLARDQDTEAPHRVHPQGRA